VVQENAQIEMRQREPDSRASVRDLHRPMANHSPIRESEKSKTTLPNAMNHALTVDPSRTSSYIDPIIPNFPDSAPGLPRCAPDGLGLNQRSIPFIINPLGGMINSAVRAINLCHPDLEHVANLDYVYKGFPI